MYMARTDCALCYQWCVNKPREELTDRQLDGCQLGLKPG